MAREAVATALEGRFDGVDISEFRGETRVVLPAESLTEAMSFLRDSLAFDYLVDITCVDYLQYRGASHRFGLVYLLASTTTAERITVRVMLDEDDGEPEVASLVDLWTGADWLEREVFDMFGIRFRGHPDLRRILMPPEFTAYPLRKDYPLQGKGERHHFPVLRRSDA